MAAMVPKVAAKGTSFKGAGLYYLHDKQAKTSERVAFTHTENLVTNDPDLTLKMMAHTAMNQHQIKAANGAARTGRKLTYPVYTYSLSWAPDEQPTQEQMIGAGKETLAALGLDGHEVLMVAHNDEPHPHVHLIVNRVHPETGKAATLSNDHLILSRWAEGYEKKHGKIRCEQRVINNAARCKGLFVKDRRSLGPVHFHQWRRERVNAALAARQATAKNQAATHAGQRQWLYKDKERRIRELREDLRQRNRAQWSALYRRQREEWKGLNQDQKTAYTRLRHYLKQRAHDPQGATRAGTRKMVQEAMRAVWGRDNPHGVLSRKHRNQREALAEVARGQVRDGIREINRGYQQELDRMRAEQRALQQEQSRQSQELAREITEGRDRLQFRKEVGKDVSGEFARRVRERLKQTKKRRDEERKRSKGEGRERD